MNRFPIRWVVALLPEAQAVIEYFQLQRSEKRSRGGFAVFYSREQDVRLVVSGVGKVNAAAATAWLAAGEPDATVAALWLNFGIAGSSALDYGSVCRADRVMDRETKRSWFPQAVWKRKFDLPGCTVESVIKPTEQYPEGKRALEMEAAGFYPIALKFGSAELVQVVKVISDGPGHSMKDITPSIATDLCRTALGEIHPWLDAVSDLVNEEQQALDHPPGFQQLLEKWHFTSTQGHQLRRLLQQSRALSSGDIELDSHLIEKSSSAREFLTNLRTNLWGDEQS